MDEQEEKVNLAETLNEPEESEEAVYLLVKLEPETKQVISVEELA